MPAPLSREQARPLVPLVPFVDKINKNKEMFTQRVHQSETITKRRGLRGRNKRTGRSVGPAVVGRQFQVDEGLGRDAQDLRRRRLHGAVTVGRRRASAAVDLQDPVAVADPINIIMSLR